MTSQDSRPAFELTITRLEVGDWPAVTEDDLAARLPGTGRLAMIARAQLEVRENMYAQACGDVLRARDRLDDAARLLPQEMRRPLLDGGCGALLPPRPPARHVEQMWIWRTARVVFREQAGLAEHEDRLRPGRATPREAFVVAAREELRWVTCDCFAIAGSRSACVQLAGSDSRLARRATQLRRLGDQRASDLDVGGLRRAGGRAGVLAAALAELASGDIVPSSGAGALPSDVPVRRGRRAAHRHARSHLADLRY